MKKRIGLIDFGSNTFHLVIALMSENNLKIIYSERAFVFLAQTGISHITSEAIHRGIEAVKEFHTICGTYEVDEIIAVGTAVLRSADNSQGFISVIQEKFGIRTQIIDGQREADLIYRGMSIACPDHKRNALFVDIGGGSTEFILTNNDHIVFQKSLPIGLGVLKNEIPFSDPVQPEEMIQFNNFLSEEAESVVSAVRKYPSSTLIGGSGTFDVLAEALTKVEFESNHCSSTEVSKVRIFIEERIHATLENRLEDPLIPQKRVHLIIHAFSFILWILDQHSFQSVVFSKFALKEGLLEEYYENWMEDIRGEKHKIK